MALTLAATVVCVGVAVGRLGISTDQAKLFSRDVPFFRDFVEFGRQFPENDGIYVVVQPRDRKAQPAVERWAAAAEAIAERLRGLPQHVKSVAARVPPDEMGGQGLLFEDPKTLRETVEETRRFIPLIRLFAEKPNVLTGLLGATPLDRFLSAMATQMPDDERAPFAAALARSWTKSLATTRPVLPNLAAIGSEDPSRLGYFYVPDQTDRSRHLLLVRVTPRENYTSLTAISETVEAIRAATADAAKAFPEFDVGLTGRPALEADEMRTTDTDSTRAEIVALSAVFVGLVLLLRSIWLAIAAEITLGVGIAWTFGWATVTLGELNLLSIVFMLALIGIGMDYLVQILSRYRHERTLRNDPRRIWVAVFRQVGAPINTATLGAAGAFLVSLLTVFRGAADLGLIAGGGLLLCLFAGYTFLPALLTIWPARRRGELTTKARRHEGKTNQETKDVAAGAGANAPSVSNVSTFSSRLRAFVVDPASHPWWLGPVIWGVLLLIAIPFALRTGFNPGLLELQAPHLRSVQLVRKLETWSAVVLSKDLEALRRAREALRGAATVERTESVLNAWDNYEALTKQIPPLPKIEWAEPTPVGAADLARLADRADGLAGTWSGAGGSREAGEAVAALREFAAAVRKTPPERAAASLSAWQVGFVEELKGMLATFDPPPPDLAKVPVALRDHLISESGVYALHIYPKEDLWRNDALERFVGEVESRIARVPGPLTLTGIAHNIAHSTASIRSSFIHSTLYALGLIFLLVWIDLRRISHTLAAVSVLALGLSMLVGLMGLFRVEWNFANFFGLPILIGAGHEYGVFLIHRYREALAHPRRGWVGWDVADRALLLCAFVTSSSFGFFFLLAHHRGLKSLGLVMALGSACIYLASVVAVRPVLKMMLSRKR
ncbi:MAG: hpnN [Phycisphaerales bacterium]|nr:hpnN [Phycisphaerales bacterium]